jgi:hypothetical protein
MISNVFEIYNLEQTKIYHQVEIKEIKNEFYNLRKS